jgi:hypothetical protein
MLPNDPRLHCLSPFQELWIAGQISKRKQADEDRLFDKVKLLCSFIDPKRAQHAFFDGEKIESEGFMDDMKAMDPNFDPKEYEEILESI